MRDVRRIRKFCNELADFWEAYVPDMRFWQVIQVIADGLNRDPFYLEESDWSTMTQDCKRKFDGDN